jgi:hypothetical protein
MAITAIANPTRLQWSNFTASSALPAGEDAHINPRFDVPNRPIRRVGTQFMLAETFQITVTPVARVKPVAAHTADLLAHEQGHYDIGLLAGRVLARDLQTLGASSPAALATALQQSFNQHTVTRLGPIQQRYDSDTQHGTNPQQQQRWNSLIRNALAMANCTQINGQNL